jgi:hypothetical protein
VFIWQTPAEWLMPSALQERMTARSSAQEAMCGIQSGEPLAGLAVLLPLALRSEERCLGFAHRGDDRAEAVGQALTGQLVQERLRIE